MTLSVAMATHNGARYLRGQLQSISGQSRQPDEMIVCDDKSTDETVAIVKEFAVDQPFPVRLFVNSERLGISANFSRAIALCQGDLIALSDQDDIWLPSKLQASEAALVGSPWADYVFSDALIIDENLHVKGTVWDSISFTHKERQRFIAGREMAILLKHNVVMGATILFRATLKTLALDVPQVAVHDAWIAILASGRKPSGLPIVEPLVKYRKHETQAIGVSLDSRDRFRTMRLRGPSDFEIEAAAYREALTRLEQRSSIVQDVHDRIEAKIQHLQTRSQMHRVSLPTRLGLIAKELRSDRYRQYSAYGIRTALRDLVFVGKGP